MSVTDAEMLAKFPRLPIDPDNRHYYHGLLEKKLLLSKCQACGHWDRSYYAMCPECWSTNVKPTEVSGKGTVYLLAYFHQGPHIAGVDYTGSYPVVAIELAEQKGLTITSTLVNCLKADAYIGMPVEVTWQEREGGVNVPVFKPAAGAKKLAGR